MCQTKGQQEKKSKQRPLGYKYQGEYTSLMKTTCMIPIKNVNN